MDRKSPLQRQQVLLLYLEGVLVHLTTDTDQLRRRLRHLFRQHGVKMPPKNLVSAARHCIAELSEKGYSAEQLSELRQQVDTIFADAESAGANLPIRLPGFDILLQQTPHAPKILLTRLREETCRQALKSVGINPDVFKAIIVLPRQTTEIEEREYLEKALQVAPDRTREFYLVCAEEHGISPAKGIPELVTIGIGEDRELTAVPPHFLVTDLGQVADILTRKRRTESISIVILAYNEAEMIRLAVEDAALFCHRHFERWELIVVNDGSSDATRVTVEDMQKELPELKLINHDRNLGMGASMRDGYTMATGDYITMLPGDRQIRADSLVALLPYVGEKRAVVSDYLSPPSGYWRALQSHIFRAIMRRIAHITVSFQGAYIFSRTDFKIVHGEQIPTDTFFYSFQLLEKMRQSGCRIFRVFIRPFPREQGVSKTNNFRTRFFIIREMLHSRQVLEVQSAHTNVDDES